MEPFRTFMLIIVALSFAFLMFSLVSNVWFFKKEDSIKGSKDLVIRKILQLAYDCYQKNLKVRGSIICAKIQISSTEDIFSGEILANLNRKKISEENFFVEDLHADSKIIIRYENGNIFIEEEKYESVSS